MTDTAQIGYLAINRSKYRLPHGASRVIQAVGRYLGGERSDIRQIQKNRIAIGYRQDIPGRVPPNKVHIREACAFGRFLACQAERIGLVRFQRERTIRLHYTVTGHLIHELIIRSLVRHDQSGILMGIRLHFQLDCLPGESTDIPCSNLERYRTGIQIAANRFWQCQRYGHLLHDKRVLRGSAKRTGIVVHMDLIVHRPRLQSPNVQVILDQAHRTIHRAIREEDGSLAIFEVHLLPRR